MLVLGCAGSLKADPKVKKAFHLAKLEIARFGGGGSGGNVSRRSAECSGDLKPASPGHGRELLPGLARKQRNVFLLIARLSLDV